MAVQPLQVRIEGVDEGADRVVEVIPLANVDPVGPGELVDDLLGIDLNAYDGDNPFVVADSGEPLPPQISEASESRLRTKMKAPDSSIPAQTFARQSAVGLMSFQSTQTVFPCARRRSSRLITNSFCSRA